MTQIFFARHGETEWNVLRRVQGSTDTALNGNGLRQAIDLGDALKHQGITHIYTSKMRRARQTAEIVARNLDVPVEVRDGLHELNLVDWEGHTWYQIERKWPRRFAEWSRSKRRTRPPHGETYEELLYRFIRAVTRIAREAQGNALIVTHSACMLSFQAELYRTPLENMLRDYQAPNAEAIPISAEEILKRWKS